MPAPAAKGGVHNIVGSPNPTPLEEWPCLVSDPQKAPASVETLLQQTGPGVNALGLPPVWLGPHIVKRCLYHVQRVGSAQFRGRWPEISPPGISLLA